jgi:hypothetical protein
MLLYVLYSQLLKVILTQVKTLWILKANNTELSLEDYCDHPLYHKQCDTYLSLTHLTERHCSLR